MTEDDQGEWFALNPKDVEYMVNRENADLYDLSDNEFNVFLQRQHAS